MIFCSVLAHWGNAMCIIPRWFRIYRASNAMPKDERGQITNHYREPFNIFCSQKLVKHPAGGRPHAIIVYHLPFRRRRWRFMAGFQLFPKKRQEVLDASAGFSLGCYKSSKSWMILLFWSPFVFYLTREWVGGCACASCCFRFAVIVGREGRGKGRWWGGHTIMRATIIFGRFAVLHLMDGFVHALHASVESRASQQLFSPSTKASVKFL